MEHPRNGSRTLTRLVTRDPPRRTKRPEWHLHNETRPSSHCSATETQSPASCPRASRKTNTVPPLRPRVCTRDSAYSNSRRVLHTRRERTSSMASRPAIVSTTSFVISNRDNKRLAALENRGVLQAPKTRSRQIDPSARPAKFPRPAFRRRHERGESAEPATGGLQ